MPLEPHDNRDSNLKFGKNSPSFQDLNIVCFFVFSPQHLYSIHLAEQPEDSTMQLADHIKVKCGAQVEPL